MSDMDDLYSGGPGDSEESVIASVPDLAQLVATHMGGNATPAQIKAAAASTQVLYQTLHPGDKVLADDGSEWVMASTNEIRISDDVVVERDNHDEESE